MNPPQEYKSVGKWLQKSLALMIAHVNENQKQV
jgi:hypothetical protein